MSLPTEMTCVEIAEPGGPEQLRITTRPVPTPAKGEVLIKVAVSRTFRAWRFRAPWPPWATASKAGP